MYRLIAALLAAASCAPAAYAQTSPQAMSTDRSAPARSGPVLTLARALELGDRASPAVDAATAGVRASDAARVAAGLRPNPSVSLETENIAGSGPYRGFASSETTASLSLPIELGGKRAARIAAADAQSARARLDVFIARADLRLGIAQAYVQAVAAERRVDIAQEQLGLAVESLRIARDRVQVGDTSPIDAQRAAVAEVNARTALDIAGRNAESARATLSLLLGRPAVQPLDLPWFDRLEPEPGYGPPRVVPVDGTLALAAAQADVAAANAGVRLAQSQRVPDITLSTGIRHLQGSRDNAAVIGISVPFPLFNGGRAQLDQARAVRDQAEARRRAALLEARTAIAGAQAELANALARARAAGPAIAAATEAARIARLGYGRGKFEQLVLIEAERTLAETRSAAVDAFAAYHDAAARLVRLTAALPHSGDTQ